MLRWAVVRHTCAGGGAGAGFRPAFVGLASSRSRHAHMPQQGLPLARLCFEMLHPLGLAAQRPWNVRTTGDVARSRGTRCGQVRSWMACSPPGRHCFVGAQRASRALKLALLLGAQHASAFSVGAPTGKIVASACWNCGAAVTSESGCRTSMFCGKCGSIQVPYAYTGSI